MVSELYRCVSARLILDCCSALPIPEKVWSEISMDFVESLPKSNSKDTILVVVDRLISDRDKIFISHFWKELFGLLKVKLCLSAAYHPQSDGQTECGQEFGAQEKLLLHLLKHNLQKAQNRMKQQADQHRSERVFEQGDWIIAKVSSVAYTLQLPADVRIHPTFHVSLLKRHVGNQPVQQHIPTRLTDQGQLLMEPVAILDRRLVRRGRTAATQVLVQWSNSFPEDATREYWYDLHQQYPHFSS
nr:uncharacterized protein LOC113722757 [Coffea arabica]